MESPIHFRTYQTRLGLVLLILFTALAGIVAAGMAVADWGRTWADGIVLLTVLLVVVAGLGLMVLALLAVRRRALYTLCDTGVREEITSRGATRIREIPWHEITEYRTGVQAYGETEYLRVRTAQRTVTLWSAADQATQQAFTRFRDQAVLLLQRHGVPAARPSAIRMALMRATAWAVLALLIGGPLYMMLIPADQRPEMWWLRWLVFAGLAGRFVAPAFRRATET